VVRVAVGDDDGAGAGTVASGDDGGQTAHAVGDEQHPMMRVRSPQAGQEAEAGSAIWTCAQGAK